MTEIFEETAESPSTPPDYVVIDRMSNSWGGNPPTNAAQYAADRYGSSYAKYATVGTIDIVRRVD